MSSINKRTKLLIILLLGLSIKANKSDNEGKSKNSIFPQRGESGYIGITKNPKDNKYFYWYFESKDKNPNAPLVIWLNGGPGCSSLIDVAVTNGPFTLGKDGKLTDNIFAWNQKANVLYIDQPLGVGYSPGEQTAYPFKAEMTREYFYEFFTKWLELDQFKKFKGHPLWLTGVSYGGHYVPQIANKFFESGNKDINLEGLVLLDPWVTNKYQNPSILDYSMTETAITKMDQAKYLFLQPWQEQCKLGIQVSCNYIWTAILGTPWRFNPYFIQRKYWEGSYIGLDFNFVQDFYNRGDVKAELGVEKIWTLCNPLYQTLLHEDYLIDCAPYLTPILNKGLKLLFIFGDKDMAVNWVGGDRMAQNIVWDGQEQYASQKFVQGKYGNEKSYKNMRFVVIPNAGHLAPYDQPGPIYELFNEFLGL